MARDGWVSCGLAGEVSPGMASLGAVSPGKAWQARCGWFCSGEAGYGEVWLISIHSDNNLLG